MEYAPRLLTPSERARLRTTVDVAALERYLVYVPPPSRGIIIVGFYEFPTSAEVLAALRADGTVPDAIEFFQSMVDNPPLPPHLAHPENDYDPHWVPPEPNLVFQLSPPETPELRKLWELIEARGDTLSSP
jgi:hypothetical protein